METNASMIDSHASNAWSGLRRETRQSLMTRDYRDFDPLLQLSSVGMDAGEVLRQRENLEAGWIPGVEIFHRSVHQQSGRGYFSELVRMDSGVLDRVGLMPRQWSSALMHGHSCKGFHIHPPHVPQHIASAQWFRDLYVDHPTNYGRRPYDREQWDIMFFLTGICEVLLVDERIGLDRKLMRFTIWGDQMPSAHNASIIIPPGVAHALRSLSQEEVVLVYGTSTTFEPLCEGRLASGVEVSGLPVEWVDYLNTDSLDKTDCKEFYL